LLASFFGKNGDRSSFYQAVIAMTLLFLPDFETALGELRHSKKLLQKEKKKSAV
jgi:hypothetical protein